MSLSTSKSELAKAGAPRIERKHSVCPELVEGVPFFKIAAEEEGQGFDKLSPNGLVLN
jgi:hypothetical protein